MTLTVGELVAELETHAKNKAVVVYAEGGLDGGVPIDGTDSYEDAIALVPERTLREEANTA